MYDTSMKIEEICLENNGVFECKCSFKKYFIPLHFRRLVPELGRDSKATHAPHKNILLKAEGVGCHYTLLHSTVLVSWSVAYLMEGTGVYSTVMM